MHTRDPVSGIRSSFHQPMTERGELNDRSDVPFAGEVAPGVSVPPCFLRSPVGIWLPLPGVPLAAVAALAAASLEATRCAGGAFGGKPFP